MVENEGCCITKMIVSGSAHVQFCGFSVKPGHDIPLHEFCPEYGLDQVSNAVVSLLHPYCGFTNEVGEHIGLFAKLHF
jgi:hypothetical protein